MLELYHVLARIERAFWLHVSGYGGVGRRDIQLVAIGFVVSGLLWAVLSRRAWMPLLIMSVGALLHIADRGMLELLPQLEISHGQTASALWFMLLGRGLALAAANGLALLGLGLSRVFRGRSVWRWGGWIVLAGQFVASIIFLDAWLIEPMGVSLSRLEISTPKLSPQAPPIHIVQLSDIHVVTYGPRERQVVARVNQLRPDLILLTGDYINALRPQTFAALQQMLGDLEAPYGIYAVTGNVDLYPRAMMEVLEPTGSRVLDNEVVDAEVRGQLIQIVGLSTRGSFSRALSVIDELRSQTTDRFRLLIAHYPDYITLSDGAQIDLYLAGHTHGGQVRLPFYGALLIDSLWQEDYDMGRYDVEGTVLFVSRGTGFSGGYEPQVRFRCPPEVVLITLRGE